MPDGRRSALALLASRTDRTGKCWLWTRGRTASGYGKFNLNGQTVYAHRASYEAYVGPIPAGLFILHSCDTPACVNPDHLRPGTHQENMRDRDTRGRGPGSKTSCPQGHAYDEANTYRTRRGGRACRACHREMMRRSRQRAAAAPVASGVTS
ncbi:HNH endonuclease [Streptomyces sp. SID5770]|nr:HNH endonuclease [Streptomyces sp. SID5770]MZE56535.1 HNH endonuclease [Streptomyces sp. SID5770]